MAGRGHEADAEALDVVEGVVERVDLELAAVAGTRVDLADAETAAEPARDDAAKLAARGFEAVAGHRRRPASVTGLEKSS